MSAEWVECASQADVDRVTAAGNITIVRTSHVVAWDTSHAVAWDTSHAVAWESSHVEARPLVAVHKQSRHSHVRGGALIDLTQITDLTGWLDYYGVKPARGSVVLYKAVNDDYRSPKGADYTPGGKPVAADWNPDPSIECGAGLHFGPAPRAAQRYHAEATRFVACRVKLADIAVFFADGIPDKVRARACVALHEVDADGVRIGVEPC